MKAKMRRQLAQRKRRIQRRLDKNNLKAWWALSLPKGPGRHKEPYHADKVWVLGSEFKTFVQAFVRLPCQVVRSGGRLVYRLLSWNPYQPIFFRLVQLLRC